MNVLNISASCFQDHVVYDRETPCYYYDMRMVNMQVYTLWQLLVAVNVCCVDSDQSVKQITFKCKGNPGLIEIFAIVRLSFVLEGEFHVSMIYPFHSYVENSHRSFNFGLVNLLLIYQYSLVFMTLSLIQ